MNNRRPLTSTNKDFQSSVKPVNDMLKAQLEANVNSLHGRYANVNDLTDCSDLLYQYSDELTSKNEGDVTPNSVKQKAGVFRSESHGAFQDQFVKDQTYLSVEKKYVKRKKQPTIQDRVDLTNTPQSSSTKGRTTATPCRMVNQKLSSNFVIDPTAFTQPKTDECENLIVNLEDIVKEEYAIFEIQECLNFNATPEKHCAKWWSIIETSSVKEMQLFFEEESSK